jgi:hypothetical protein
MINRKIEFVTQKTTPAKKLGRPSKYRPQYDQMLLDYFNEKEPTELVTQSDGSKKLQVNDLPMLEIFANKIQVSTTALDGWATETYKDGKTLKHPGFHAAMEIARNVQKKFLSHNGLKGHYSASFTAFLGKNMVGWRDHKEVELSSDPNKPLVSKIEVQWTEPESKKVEAEFK